MFGMIYGQPKHRRVYSKPAHIVIINQILKTELYKNSNGLRLCKKKKKKKNNNNNNNNKKYISY